MKIHLDGQEYQLDMHPLLLQIQEIYISAREKASPLVITSLKTMLVPFLLPYIEAMYRSSDMALPAPERHADMLNYCMTALLFYYDTKEKSLRVNLASKTNADSSKTIIAVSSAIVSKTEDGDERVAIDSRPTKESTQDT